MPQLDPAPWFLLFFYTWLIFATIIPTKVKSFLFPNDPNYQLDSMDTKSWTWPWH
uniref:ATP synthase F0 subunit 8 n=1 Tax=Inegocia japonica TaxID=1230726 RepID=UPI0020281087|nr:ATP synthase F0 subunit 8 [Inegocia japonica]UPT34435.1 ATP synthase F0 subunit 8 [Inegocia japonica]